MWANRMILVMPLRVRLSTSCWTISARASTPASVPGKTVMPPVPVSCSRAGVVTPTTPTCSPLMVMTALPVRLPPTSRASCPLGTTRRASSWSPLNTRLLAR